MLTFFDLGHLAAIGLNCISQSIEVGDTRKSVFRFFITFRVELVRHMRFNFLITFRVKSSFHTFRV